MYDCWNCRNVKKPVVQNRKLKKIRNQNRYPNLKKKNENRIPNGTGIFKNYELEQLPTHNRRTAKTRENDDQNSSQ